MVTGAVLLMASAFDTMTGLHSIDTRQMLNRSLGSGSLGLSLDQATGAMHVAVLVCGGASAAAAVLGIYVLRGDRVARVALGAVAIVVALSAPFAGMFFGTLVAIGAALLWSRPARDWFAGRPAAEAGPTRGPDSLRQDSAPPPDEVPRPAAEQAPQQPPPHTGYGQPVSSYPSGQPSGQQDGQPSGPPTAPLPYGQPPNPPHPGYGAAWGPRPPSQVRTSSLITYVLSGIVIVLYGFIILAMLVQPDDVVNGLLKQADKSGRNFTAGEIRAVVWSVCIVFEIWAVAAVVLARLVVRRQNWARITLIVSAVVALLVSVLSTISFPLAGIYIVGCGVVIGQLASRVARAWTASVPPVPPGPPGAYGAPPPYQQPPQPPPGDQGGQPPVW